jgi:AraC-like DNA-binding protein
MTDFRKNFVVSMLAYAVQKDIPPETLCRQAGIDLPALQGGGKVELNADQVDLLWQNALYKSQDPLFGLHFGEVMQLNALGIVGAIVRNSPTIGDALQQCVAYTPLLTDLFDMKLDHGSDVSRRPGGSSEGRSRPGGGSRRFAIRLLPFPDKMGRYPVMQRQTLDLSMAFILHELDGLLLTKMKPELVILPHVAEHEAEYRRVLRCDRVLAGDEYYMEFDGALWDMPIVMANYELQGLLLAYADRYKVALDGSTSIRTRISNLLHRTCYLGMPGLDEVAANLNLSVRSLQRRLREEGVNFQELAESVRKTMALRYLEGGAHQVKEIAAMLGYTDIGAFTRAFKRWTGKTPSEHRAGR